MPERYLIENDCLFHETYNQEKSEETTQTMRLEERGSRREREELEERGLEGKGVYKRGDLDPRLRQHVYTRSSRKQ